MRSDAVNIKDGKIWYIGVYGNDWSRVSRSESGAYFLTMGPAAVNPSHNNGRWFGFPLRYLSGRCKIKSLRIIIPQAYVVKLLASILRHFKVLFLEFVC